jgi:hypothetical protein
MKYHKCLNCGFNVTEQDERCQNCGVLHPLVSLELKELDTTIPTAIGTILPCIILLIVMYSIGQKRGDNDWIILSACMIPMALLPSYFVSILVVSIYKNFYDAKYKNDITNRRATFPESLIYKENLINQRKKELSKREDQVMTVLSKAKLNTDEKWKQVSTMLEDSIKTLKRQEAKYNLKSIEIDMVRLQNEIAPFVYNTDGFSYNQIDANLKIIEGVKGTANGIGNQINNQSKFLDSSEPKELTQRITEIQSSIDKLHDAYLGKQAVLALQDINPVDDASNPILPPVKAIQESEVFNTQVSITDFSESLKELESEYMRVQAEEDIAKQVDKLINETNTPI